MTLATRIIFRNPANPEKVYDLIDSLINDRGVPSEALRYPGEIRNTIGQGNRSMLDVTYAIDGPLDDTAEYLADMADYPDEIKRDPMERSCAPGPYCLMVRLDTTYDYHEDGIGGCSDLHGGIVLACLAAFPDADIAWYNEYQGTWHNGNEGMTEFADNALDAEMWFECMVKPALVASGAEFL